MTIFIGADHAGFKLKEEIKRYLSRLGLKYQDLGNLVFDPNDDYPDFAELVAKRVAREKGSRGILICGTGQGMALAANKVKGAYATLACNELTGRLAREHSQTNVLALGAWTVKPALAKKIIKIWLTAKPSKKIRYLRRINKIKKIEAESMNH